MQKCLWACLALYIVVANHPVGRRVTFDWSVISFIMVVYKNVFKFSQNCWTKEQLNKIFPRQPSKNYLPTSQN